MAAEPLTELELAIETVVTTFFTFAKQEGQKGSLNTAEFKELVTQQLPHLLKDWTQSWLPGDSQTITARRTPRENTVHISHFTYMAPVQG
ncbi:protein S100-A13 [Cebus imitator]|uniref:protein S100-A13 n=1 Tax=Cebus imitator TaxID=2715852 RepID=UPI00080A1034|nr:protein S100-A13 [Cebus imitator]XP_017368809.1 protein S100-A13 [Cebus imitator]XP_017368810.1 protein S100-A13 [Cebus imitator]